MLHKKVTTMKKLLASLVLGIALLGFGSAVMAQDPAASPAFAGIFS